MKEEIKMIQRSIKSIFVCLLPLFFIQSSVAIEGQRNGLVNVEWLFKNLNNPELVILDASPAQAYKAGHIQGALSYDIYSYGPREMPVPETEKRLQSWGISPGKKIIIYDQGGDMMATRLAYSLEYYGFPEKDIYVMDGGRSKWKEAGYALTADISPSPEKAFEVTH
jgi:3-mercaptopyruvate sulfurtransferase SseA